MSSVQKRCCWFLVLIGSFTVACGDPNVTPAGEVAPCRDCLRASLIVAGGEHSCALSPQGSVSCWGYGENGILGAPATAQCRDGMNTNTCSLRPQAIPTLVRVTSLAAGLAHTCALLDDASVECWGFNPYGAIGDGTMTTRLTPVAVSGLAGVRSLASGNAHTCAVLVDGTALCWGVGTFGCLGNGGTAGSLTPRPVMSISDGVQIDLGAGSSCVRLRNGTVSCWGWNHDGQLGDGSHTDRVTPVAVLNVSNAVRITVGGHHACALLADGTVRCWGANEQGQLGDGTTQSRSTPVQVSALTDIRDVAAGEAHTCAVNERGEVFCWGSNDHGQVAVVTASMCSVSGSSLPCVLTAVRVPGLASMSQISTGGGHTCALGRDQSVSCWGWNRNGQVGNGTTDSAPAPQRLRPSP